MFKISDDDIMSFVKQSYDKEGLNIRTRSR